ncbi:hypothetical protein MJH12_20030, partial [bacterium]|nr:hypothetical protein [bacterium]
IVAYRLYWVVDPNDRRSGSCSAFSLLVIAFCFVSLSGNVARVQATQEFVKTIVIHSANGHHAPAAHSDTQESKHH